MRNTRQILALAAASLFGITAQVRAQEITFTGIDAGCVVNAGTCTPDGVTNLNVNGPLGLSVFGDGFNGTTVGHFLGLSTGLGRINLGPQPANYNNTFIAWTYAFVNPNGVANQTFGTTQIIGSVQNTQNGIAIIWANDSFSSAKTFSFSEVVGGNTYTGTARFWLNDVSIKSDGTDNRISGNFAVTINTTTPEPASIALFATGLVGMIPVVRYSRRRNRA